jgi:hypothetical protein
VPASLQVFRVEAGPRDGAGGAATESRLRAELAQIGVRHLRVPTGSHCEYGFELAAETVGQALDKVTRVFRSVYGSNWWADVAQVADTFNGAGLKASLN